eukprot:2589029-Alexandrium_andersonii.AAC.1
MAARPRPSAAPFATPTSSSAPELEAMVFRVVGQRLTARNPLARTPPQGGLPSAQAPDKISPHTRAEGGPSLCRGKR